MASYATRALIKARLNITDTSSDSQVDLAGTYATKFIDDYTGRTFATVAGTHYFTRADLDPANSRRLFLDDDLLGVISLKNGDSAQTVIASTDYFLEPRNTSPKWSILLKADSDAGGWTFDTDGEIEVAGSWAYSASADDLIVGICARIAEWWFRSSDLIETTSIYSESVVPAKQPGFPTEVLTELDLRKRLR